MEEDPFAALDKLRGWDWRKPRAIGDIVFEKILQSSFRFLNSDETSAPKPTVDNIRTALDNCDERLSKFLPGLIIRLQGSNPEGREAVAANAREWCRCDFERMLVDNAVSAVISVSAAGLDDRQIDLDDLILRAASFRWQKVAMIVGTILMARRGLTDTAVAERVKALVQHGRLEAQGDPIDMRFSEVRKPSA